MGNNFDSDKYAELFEKIMGGEWEMEDLDELTILAHDEGYVCGELAGKLAAEKAFREFLISFKVPLSTQEMEECENSFMDLLGKVLE